VWTPDGQRIIFSSDRAGAPNLFWQAANGTGTAEPLTEGNNAIYAHTMSPDGKGVVLRRDASASEGGGPDLLFLDVGEGPRVLQPAQGLVEPKPLVQTPFSEFNAEISPGGRWLAYQSNSSGAYEVYVRPFPDVAGGQWLVSTGGGTEPLWAPDGRELFYRAPNGDGAVMRVPILPGPAWTAGTPTRLIDAQSYALGGRADLATTVFRTYDVSLDGRRFLMIKNAEGPTQTSAAPRIVVVQHWFEELKRRVPVN
jgi:serine/threonine-protein kinase